MLIHTVVKERLDAEPDKKHGPKIQVQLLEKLFTLFDVGKLADSNFHSYLCNIIKTETRIHFRKRMAKVLGGRVIANLIKDKRYRKPLTDFIDELRISPNFRDRQMYLVTARAALKADKEVFKKHFAKAIGNEMCLEKVTIVKILMAKLVSKVERGYSKSADKAFEWLQATDKTGEVTQYLGALSATAGNQHLRQRRYIDPEDHRVTLKQDELSQTLTSMNSSISKS
jgi:hypothetical protein